MNPVYIHEIIRTLSEVIPEHWQEDFDNSGLQIGDVNRRCTGVLLCVDATPDTVIEAYERHCNLIITHHPLIFHPLKQIAGQDRVSRTIIKAIKNDICIYSCHTPVDNAPGIGVSWAMAHKIGLKDITVLEQGRSEGIGTGIVGNLPREMCKTEFVELVKAAFDTPTARCSSLTCPPRRIKRVAIGGGACANFIPDAIKADAQAMIVSDCKLNHFIDYLGQIFITDIGHYEAEKCTKEIFYHIIREKFPNFALYYSEEEINPINYL